MLPVFMAIIGFISKFEEECGIQIKSRHPFGSGSGCANAYTSPIIKGAGRVYYEHFHQLKFKGLKHFHRKMLKYTCYVFLLV